MVGVRPHLRNVAAAVGPCGGRPVEEVTVGGGDVVEQLQRSSAADFGLRGESAYIDAVIAAVNDEANLVEKEHKIDLIRWNEAVELATFDYFDINAILSYLVRSTSWRAGRARRRARTRRCSTA